jgi:hypothetical protein
VKPHRLLPALRRRPGRYTSTKVRRPWVRRLRRTLLAGSCVFVLVVAWSVGGALTAPGTDSVPARLAEWARNHGMGGVVTYLEQQQYQHHQPAVGGAPVGGIPSAAAPAPGPAAPSGPGGLPAPGPLPNLAGGGSLPGEGQWATVADVGGQPAVRVALLRPDPQHTSYLAGVMWIDPTLVRGQLRPGFQDPGGSWQAADALVPADQRTVVAAFNAGFRLPHDTSHGGYYSEGRTAVPLVNGAASLVLHRDGAAEVGSWNQEVHMTADVASVRQNLVMLVDSGRVNPTCQTGGGAEWGSTVGNAAYIDRSAFGVTPDGAEVYVGGPALSVCTLGRIMQAAGVVRGMELDINPAWISAAYFHTTATDVRGFKLYPAEQVPPQHFLSPSSRDWFAWFARGPQDRR